MEEISVHELEQLDTYFLFIYTKFCGTCQVARSFLERIEAAHKQQIFYELNASFHPEYMQRKKIEQVPCFLIKKNGEIKEKIYTFYSPANMYRYVWEYAPQLFTKNK